MHADLIGPAHRFASRPPGVLEISGSVPARHPRRCHGEARRTSSHLGATLLVVVLAIGFAACGGGTSKSAKPAATTRPSSPVSTTSPASTVSPTEAAVLAAYRAASHAFQQALADANPDDPSLVATMTGPQLQGVRANLYADQRQGIVGRGSATLHPKIAALSSTSATVVDCVYSTIELVYKATGKPVPPVTPPENDGVTATLVLSGGQWKVYKQIVTDGRCAPGS